MREVLYRKYRPKNLSEVKGQLHITSTLENAVKTKKISHGYLFSGPRGVGKTSVARILAYNVNNFGYGDDNAKLDIIEIDAASNRRIDEIRELRDKIHSLPVVGKYKVYIIDEVHMLTREAFNALLKTLEEPPTHVIFILATTEVHKLPDTIVSRTQHFNFKSISEDVLIQHLDDIAHLEGLNIDNNVLKLIATHSDGSFRDSVSLLDQVSSFDKIGIEQIEELLSLPSHELVDNLIELTLQGDIKAIKYNLDNATNTGVNFNQLLSALIGRTKNLIYLKPSDDLFNLAKILISQITSTEINTALEIALLDFAFKIHQQTDPITKTLKQPLTLPKETSNFKTQKINTIDDKPLKASKLKKNINILDAENYLKQWDQVLSILKQKYNTLYGIARMATVEISDNDLLLKVKYGFHQKKLKESKNASIIKEVLRDTFDNQLNFKVELTSATPEKEKMTESAKLPTKTSTSSIENITNIFGGGELLET